MTTSTNYQTIRWTNIEKAAVENAVMQELLSCKVVNIDTGEVSMSDLKAAVISAQGVLPLKRRKDDRGSYQWGYVNKGFIEAKLLEHFQAELPAGPEEAIKAIEDCLRYEDIEVLDEMESRFRMEAVVRFEKVRSELLDAFSAKLTQDLQEAQERVLAQSKASLEKGMKQLEEIQRGPYNTIPVKKTLPRVLVVGLDSSQIQILNKNYGSKVALKTISRDSNPSNWMESALRADKVYLMGSQVGSSFESKLRGHEYQKVSGGISTLTRVLEEFLAQG